MHSFSLGAILRPLLNENIPRYYREVLYEFSNIGSDTNTHFYKLYTSNNSW